LSSIRVAPASGTSHGGRVRLCRLAPAWCDPEKGDTVPAWPGGVGRPESVTVTRADPGRL